MVTIKIEIGAGTHIRKAFEEAIRIASILHVWVEFNHNGVKCLATENGDAEIGEVNWWTEFFKDESNGVRQTAFAS